MIEKRISQNEQLRITRYDKICNNIELPLARLIGNDDYKMASRKTVKECCEKAGLKLENFEIRKGMRLPAVVRSHNTY